MLRRLTLKDYGLVASAEIEFSAGATMFTGETGSGKTMILGALAFALGARASGDVVRRESARAIVTLAFEPDDGLRERMATDGFESDPGEEATIVREMTDAGKSSVRVNGRSATASYVRELAPAIAEIVGQHEAQRLLSPSYHLDVLDRYADAMRLRSDVASAYDVWTARRRELDAIAGDERRAQQRYDDAAFALDEIEGLAPEAGEDERLTERRRYLDNVERIAVHLQNAHEALAADEASATALLGAASASLGAIADMSTEIGAIHGQASALQSEASELATRIARQLDATEFDASELETINTRLDALDRAKRKYGSSIEAILAHAEDARRIVAEYEAKDERVAALTRALAEAERALNQHAALLTQRRSAAAKRLADAVTAEFADLALASGRFDVALSPLDAVGPDGAESVEFVFAANAGESLRRLGRVASGGELSRLLLALVVALSASGERTALVFDEIDAGIGGATATAVGTRLARLAGNSQVICVTHLAQLATWADRHYVLEKSERKGSTTISIREIDGDEARASELARMLSGEAHDAALEHARALLKAAR